MFKTEIKAIAKIRTPFKEKFGIPRQSGIANDAEAIIVFEPEYRTPDALRGIEGYSHLWLLWEFSEVEEKKDRSLTVRPPRLGGNKKMGVFSTRSPYRPNRIGLSSVRLAEVRKTENEGYVLIVFGADLLDGTPILDIKPYLAYTDSHPDAVGGFSDTALDYKLETELSEEIKKRLENELSESDIKTIITLLENDPRPAYKNEGEAVYGMRYGNINISFRVTDGKAIVLDIQKIDEGE